MSSELPKNRAAHPAVRIWLLLVAALMVLTLSVGGATRLTESGLSIVEWRPVTGVTPPLGEAAWQAEFDKYKTIPQYRERNTGMSLAAFKVIYWWEWSHRMLARFVGAAFLFPFVFFLWRGMIGPRLRLRLWVIFGLGGVLGAVGWWMVSSGLSDRVTVSPYRLAFHLTLACAIFAFVLATARGLGPRAPSVVSVRLRVSAAILLVLVLAQIYLGALVAGLRAGLLYNTWPLIDGNLVPAAKDLFFEKPLWKNFFENPLTVQFDHRMMAYVLWLFAVLHAADVARRFGHGFARATAIALAAAVTLQAGIGIWTLLWQAPIALALLHQATAIVVLAIAVVHAQHLSGRAGEAAVATPVTGAG
jgi:cytochrome c oxidase assembly protein subunit 15